MKKIFAKLAMALCLTAMVSCGGSDNGGSGSGSMSPQQAAQKTMEIETTYNHELAKAMQASDAELFVKAVEKYYAAQNKVQNFDENSIEPALKQDLDNIVRANGTMFGSAQRQFYRELNDQQKERFHKATGIPM